MADEDLIIKLTPLPHPVPHHDVVYRHLKANWIAILAVAVSIGSAIFTGLQWHDNREAVKVTQGPYLEITKAVPEGQENLRIKIRNIGKTPALNPESHADVFVASDPIGGSYAKLDAGAWSAGVMWLPSIPTDTEAEFFAHFPDVATFQKLLKTPSQRIIELRGIILYQDSFNNSFRTPYCYQLRETDEGLSDVSTCFSEGPAKLLRKLYKR